MIIGSYIYEYVLPAKIWDLRYLTVKLTLHAGSTMNSYSTDGTYNGQNYFVCEESFEQPHLPVKKQHTVNAAAFLTDDENSYYINSIVPNCYISTNIKHFYDGPRALVYNTLSCSANHGYVHMSAYNEFSVSLRDFIMSNTSYWNPEYKDTFYRQLETVNSFITSGKSDNDWLDRIRCNPLI